MNLRRFQKIILNPQFQYFRIQRKKKLFISPNNSEKIKEINIYNQIGQKVFHGKPNTISIDVSELQEGLYVIELVTNKSKFREKLIIK
ncbi:MAG: T9SS type A sorting domain-containing protein [Bacteroidales bacterium]|nr:T9SS type A sorting domain-containing protein [Bacteroidales bacterium]